MHTFETRTQADWISGCLDTRIRVLWYNGPLVSHLSSKRSSNSGLHFRLHPLHHTGLTFPQWLPHLIAPHQSHRDLTLSPATTAQAAERTSSSIRPTTAAS
jgi:hypothetical protein